ncbi:MAG: enoyl-CoA hydratase/isomerase family protein [Chloroflexi bacterium]|nr:enoyl-CoA hydratase/isomerase family protein [Chloroflexota bacterium]
MPLQYAKEGKIAIFTLNRPEAMNSMDPDTLKEYHEALVDFRDDDNLWVGVVTGSGNKAFCAGADVKKTLPWMKELVDRPWSYPQTTMRGLELWKPLIAAVNGLALGGGFEIALSCDIRIASENAMFGVPEVRLGLIPGWGGTARLSQMLPASMAAEMLFTGKPINAQEAYRLGLVNRVVSLSELMNSARQTAASICECAPLAVRDAKRVMQASRQAVLDGALRLEAQFFDQLLQTEDFEEGTAAFVGKRPANFRGK